MLVLRRKINERIILDGQIAIEVLAIEGSRIKLGISAPPNISILREELLTSRPLSSNSYDPENPASQETTAS